MSVLSPDRALAVFLITIILSAILCSVAVFIRCRRSKSEDDNDRSIVAVAAKPIHGDHNISWPLHTPTCIDYRSPDPRSIVVASPTLTPSTPRKDPTRPSSPKMFYTDGGIPYYYDPLTQRTAWTLVELERSSGQTPTDVSRATNNSQVSRPPGPVTTRLRSVP